MFGTGYLPVPLGNRPSGMEETFAEKPEPGFVQDAATISSDEPLDRTDWQPVFWSLDILKFSASRREIRE